ncbi:MAG: 2-hydroxyacid dehydrogenase [Raineya sp.]
MNVLIIDDVHPLLLDFFEKKQIHYTYLPNCSKEEVYSLIGEYEGLVVRSKIYVSRELLTKASKLVWIARAGSGMDNIDVQTAQEKNIVLLNAPEGNRDAVAEHCLGMLLSLLNKIHTAHQEVKQKIWQREANRGMELKGKTFGIIGYGNTGRELARRLSNFGCRVLAYDYKENLPSDTFAEMVSLQFLQQEADIISLHVSLNEKSRMMLNKNFIEKCSKKFVLLNTSRGEVADLEAILWGLQEKKILAAGLDVLENEKLNSLSPEQEKVFQALAATPNVLLTPHVAGWTQESYKKISEVLAQKIVQLL